MKILTGILNFLKNAFSKKNIKFTLSIIVILLIIFNLNTCNRLKKEKISHKRDNAIHENNITAMTDSIHTYYDKEMDKMVSEKPSLLVKNIEDLKKYNEEMYEEFKSLKNIVVGIQSDVNITIPKLIGEIKHSEQDPNDPTKFNIPFSFKFSDDGITTSIIGGSNIKISNNYPTILNSHLDTNFFNIKLRYAITEDDDKYTVKAFSPSNLVKFDELDGALHIDKVNSNTYNSPWVLGPYVGIGLNTDIKGGNSRWGWSFGAAVSYNFLNKSKNKNKWFQKKNK